MNAPVPEGRLGRASAAPVGRGLIRFLWNSNPFYPISAVFVLVGLRTSCDPLAATFPTWIVLSGLASYTLLMAGMAVFLVRCGGVWEDVRTLVLLIALILLAIPAFLDDILARHLGAGALCEVVAFAFAIGVSEAVLRGMQLRWPLGYRFPYHLALCLFFLHPIAGRWLAASPEDPAVMWALFAFPSLAGCVALTLIPAARRGAAYAKDSGSPWRWPLYPWTMFGLIGLAVGIRSYSHCLAVGYSGGTNGYESIDSTIFGPYFLVPFGLAIAALLLEAGLASRSRNVVRLALAAPLLLAVLAASGHRPDATYQRFLRLFLEAAGGSPLFVALIAAVGFYLIAALRRVAGALDALTLAIASFAFIGPDTIDAGGLTTIQAVPLLVAAFIQMSAGVVIRSTWRGAIATGFLAMAMSAGPVGGLDSRQRSVLAIHVALVGVMVLGAVGRDRLASFLRGLSAPLLGLAAIAPLLDSSPFGDAEWLRAYPIIPLLAAVGYGWIVSSRMHYAVAMLGLIWWLGDSGVRLYAALRRLLVGLDQIMLGLAAFAIAAFISLIKAGLFRGRIAQPSLARTPNPPMADRSDEVPD